MLGLCLGVLGRESEGDDDIFASIDDVAQAADGREGCSLWELERIGFRGIARHGVEQVVRNQESNSRGYIWGSVAKIGN
jgi:hypothetical protein